MWWLYTSEENAQTELAKVNANIKRFNPSANYLTDPNQLTAKPEIDNIVYTYGFPKPDENIQAGVNWELEAEWNQSWFIQEEI
jgi:hypothetical protein